MSEDVALDKAELMLFTESDSVLVSSGYTNSKGEFSFTVEPGDYKILAFKDDFTTAWVRYISVKDNTVAVKVELVPEVFEEDKKNSKEDDCD